MHVTKNNSSLPSFFSADYFNQYSYLLYVTSYPSTGENASCTAYEVVHILTTYEWYWQPMISEMFTNDVYIDTLSFGKFKMCWN